MNAERRGLTGRRIGVALGATYLACIVGLYLLREGIAAAFLTMPGWYLVVVPVFLWLTPYPAFERFVVSWHGDLVLLLVSAAVNIGIVYIWIWLMRRW